MLLTEGIVTETVLGRKKFFFVAVYRPHHMSADDFEMFIQRIELLTDYISVMKNRIVSFLLVILIVDVNSGGPRTTRIIRE